jgi:DNA-binding transcriptional LysR family regulator
MLEVRDLRMVRAIHEQGSLARAARVLGVGQPALRFLAKAGIDAATE